VSQDPQLWELLTRLARLERAPHGVQLPPPLVLGTKEAYHRACADAGFPGHLAPEIRGAPVLLVPLQGVRTIQRSVNPDRVAQYLRNPDLMRPGQLGKHGGLVDLPIVVRAGGVDRIHDGHHRVLSNILRGETSVRARYLDLDALGARSESRPIRRDGPPGLAGWGRVLLTKPGFGPR
jgi:hypothetical protein